MKKLLGFILISILAIALSACTDTPNDGTLPPAETETSDGTDLPSIPNNELEDNMQVYFTVGERTLTATLEDNRATAALIEKLKTAPITVNMSDYGGWEKVGDLGFDLPTSNEQITAHPCEFVLYQGDQLVIFYGSNSWSYTRLGKIEGLTSAELKEVLGDGNVTVTISLPSLL